MSLLLDDSNFDALFIDGKTVNKMFFKGEEIYGRYFAAGNRYTSSKFTTTWGGTNRKLYPQTDTEVKLYPAIGNNGKSLVNLSLCPVNSIDFKMGTLLSITKLEDALSYMSISSFTECTNVYYVARFQQNTYDGDLMIKPFMLQCYASALAYNKKYFDYSGIGVDGIGNREAGNSNEGLSFLYPASARGKTLQVKAKLDDAMVSRLDRYAKNNSGDLRFFCKAFKTDDSTAITRATAYFGGYLLFEM